jgi:hypothetical protein
LCCEGKENEQRGIKKAFFKMKNGLRQAQAANTEYRMKNEK